MGNRSTKQSWILFKNAVVRENLKKGDPLPSSISIKNAYSLSGNTVITAFDEFNTRGNIQSAVRKGVLRAT